MKDGKTLRLGDRYEIVLTLGICSLEVAVCEPKDAGKYTCVAENSQGTEECTCKVTVNGKLNNDSPQLSVITDNIKSIVVGWFFRVEAK